MSDHLEDRLRAELSRRAEHAPTGTLLAERIIAAARTQSQPAGRRGWPTWTLPLLAAGAVAAIVTGVFVGVSAIRESASPAGPGVGTQIPSLHHPTPTQPKPTPTPTPTSAGSNSPTVHSSNPPNPVGLTNFAASDLTFYGTDDGWATGAADCLDGSGATCPAMVRTTDGGRSWHSMPQPPGAVTGIRFATPEIGYAFGASVLEMTTNGGQSWTTQSGGAIALETLDGNVIRLVSDGPGCPGPCNVRVEYADLGTSVWTTAKLAAGQVDVQGGVQLVRSKSNAYVLVTGHTAGGAGNAQSTLYASIDDGAGWTARGEPCQLPIDKQEIDSVAIAAAPGGTVALTCRPRIAGDGFLTVSHDSGVHFTPAAGVVPRAGTGLLAGDPSTVLVSAGGVAYRSSDGGASWSPINDVSGAATFVGFESQTLGRIVTDEGRTVWTTTDGGGSWTPFSFPTR